MDLLINVIQPYAWGSRTALAELQRRPTPSPTPEAELWMGAHPAAPSQVLQQGERRPLNQLIREDPERLLGPGVAAAYGGNLPFLLKVLAADKPLSLQAHPDRAQAAEGFARENAAGVPLEAPHRLYKDANPKPELVCALTEFDALCGFRSASDALALFTELRVPALREVVAALADEREGMRTAFSWMMSLPHERRATLVPDVVRAAEARRRSIGARFEASLRWAARLGELYPDDPGVIASLLMNHVRLLPGQAMYLEARVLHAYLQGTAVEIMASSDNVLRGGCTPKHVDVPELLRVLDFHPRPAAVLAATPRAQGESVYETPAAEFQLSRLEVRGSPLTPSRQGPEIVLCARGSLTLRAPGQHLQLSAGASGFINAQDPSYTVEGEGLLFRATLPPEAEAGVHRANDPGSGSSRRSADPYLSRR